MLTQNRAALPPIRQASGVIADSPGGIFGETLVSRLTPEFHSMVKSGLPSQIQRTPSAP